MEVLLVPPLFLVPAFVIPSIYRLFRFIFAPTTGFVVSRYQEVTELIFYVGLFLFVALAFTNARAWVTDQSTVNRATLHFAPLLVVFVMLAFRAFAERWAATHPGPAVAPAGSQTPAT